MTACPYCKCKDLWYISTSENEMVYQCIECSKYFKVKVLVQNYTPELLNKTVFRNKVFKTM